MRSLHGCDGLMTDESRLHAVSATFALCMRTDDVSNVVTMSEIYTMCETYIIMVDSEDHYACVKYFFMVWHNLVWCRSSSILVTCCAQAQFRFSIWFHWNKWGENLQFSSLFCTIFFVFLCFIFGHPWSTKLNTLRFQRTLNYRIVSSKLMKRKENQFNTLNCAYFQVTVFINQALNLYLIVCWISC